MSTPISFDSGIPPQAGIGSATSRPVSANGRRAGNSRPCTPAASQPDAALLALPAVRFAGIAIVSLVDAQRLVI